MDWMIKSVFPLSNFCGDSNFLLAPAFVEVRVQIRVQTGPSNIPPPAEIRAATAMKKASIVIPLPKGRFAAATQASSDKRLLCGLRFSTTTLSEREIAPAESPTTWC
ncbi:unnamed protein product [Natator depressus]